MSSPTTVRERFEERFIRAFHAKDKAGNTSVNIALAIEIMAFIQSELTAQEVRVRDGRDQQILSWHKIPIKVEEEGKIGPIDCDACGGRLFRIRGKFPKTPNRAVCPTCAIEILEHIYSNLYPNNQAVSLPHPLEGRGKQE